MFRNQAKVMVTHVNAPDTWLPSLHPIPMRPQGLWGRRGHPPSLWTRMAEAVMSVVTLKYGSHRSYRDRVQNGAEQGLP